MRSTLVLGLALSLFTAGSAASCEMAQIMFGAIQLDIVPKSDYETALIRHADFRDPKWRHGQIKGEIEVERDARFVIRNLKRDLVGMISRSLEIEGGDGCGRQSKVVIRKVQPGAYVIMNGDIPVGTIKDGFPRTASAWTERRRAGLSVVCPASLGLMVRSAAQQRVSNHGPPHPSRRGPSDRSSG